jgi:hypothetical protein
MCRFLKVVIAVLIMILTAVAAVGCQGRDIEYPKASDGILDLREWDFNTGSSKTTSV